MIRFVCALLATAWLSYAQVELSKETFFVGACDASAGAMLTDDLFAAADDESNRIRVFSLSRGGAALFDLPLTRFLSVDPREPESDIEGAARVGDVIYWITSHARNKDGKLRTSRQRFFATRIVSTNPPRLEAQGRAYDQLLLDLQAAPQLRDFELDEAAALAPKEKHALNIEGLCARADGSLLIAFRNPVPQKQALLVPLLNPSELIKGGSKAKFREPVRLDLGGRGVRDIVQRAGKYFLVAGAHNGADRFELYEFDGVKTATPLHRWPKKSINPEAILAFPQGEELLVLTDEGSKGKQGRECKDMPPSSRRFRGVVVTGGAD